MIPGKVEELAVFLAHMLPYMMQGHPIEVAAAAVRDNQERARAVAELDRRQVEKALLEMQPHRVIPPSALIPNWHDAPVYLHWYCIFPPGDAWWSEDEPRIGDDLVSWMWSGRFATAGRVNIPLGVDWRILKFGRPVEQQPAPVAEKATGRKRKAARA